MFSRALRKNASLYIMILPAVVLVFIFSYMPLAGLRLAFHKYTFSTGMWGGKFVGLRYFESFFSDPYCGRLIRNTFLLSFYTLIFTFPVPIILALLLNEVSCKPYKALVQSVSYLPYFISTVVVVGIMMKMFSGAGVVNMFLRSIDVKEQLFFSDSKWFRPLYIMSEVWTTTGYSAVVYLAVLAGVPQELYEAARIDGANRFKRVIYVTLPCIVPTIRVLLIMSLGNLMRVGFNKVFLMATPVIYETSDIIETYIYRRGLVSNDFSYATAVGLFNSAISFVIVFAANYISKKVSQEGLF
jgi:putative aldouronate transport system permease protein